MEPDPNQSTVVCAGELLWDIFPDGRRLLGGAPANVAYHLGKQGVDARLLTRVGKDELGALACRELEAAKLSMRYLQVDPSLPTGVATIRKSIDGAAGYEFLTPAAWDAIEPLNLTKPAAVVFGTLAQRHPTTRDSIRLLAQKSHERIYDINLRPPHTSLDIVDESLRLSTMVKLNEDEVRDLATAFSFSTEPRSFSHAMMNRYDVQTICVTRGARGAWLSSRDGIWDEVDGAQTRVVDTVGAGDAFLAALIANRLRGKSWSGALAQANRLAAWVASQVGAMPAYPGE